MMKKKFLKTLFLVFICLNSFAQQDANIFDEEAFKLDIIPIAEAVLQKTDTVAGYYKSQEQIKYVCQSDLTTGNVYKRIVVLSLEQSVCYTCGLEPWGSSPCYLVLVVSNHTKSLSKGFVYEFHTFSESFDGFIHLGKDYSTGIIISFKDYRGMGVQFTEEKYIVSLKDNKVQELAKFDSFGYSVMPYSKKGDILLNSYSNFEMFNGKLYVYFFEQILLESDSNTYKGKYQENLYVISYAFDNLKEKLVKRKQVLISTEFTED